MMKRLLRLAAIWFVISGCVYQQGVQKTLLSSPWGGSWQGQGYAARVSSYDRTGANVDAIRIGPGETATLANIDGPGVIRHIWTTTNADVTSTRTHILRFYWDGSEHPSVEAPLGDFFGVGNAMLANVHSWPITVLAGGRSRNCWWPMPFAEGCKITVTNEGPDPTSAFYYYIDYLALDSAPNTTLRFHAQYRQAYPADFPENYVILETTGEGQYLGCIYSVESTEPNWWGEGDDLIEVDDREPLRGTGTEDYFCDAWGMREQSTLFHGTPVCEGYDDAGLRSSMYRFHILDPIPFRKTIRVSIEHGHANDRADHLSSVAFWYQTLPAASFPALPPVEERIGGEERIAYLQKKAWRLATGDSPGAAEQLAQLLARPGSLENVPLVEGLIAYVEGKAKPDEDSLARLERHLAELKRRVDALPEQERYAPARVELPTDDDNPVPGSTVAAQRMLERARYDLARRVAERRGLQPGDEIVVEARDALGNLTPPPAYEDSDDFSDSYAKVDDPHLMGSGARFTYGNADSSRARFTPDFPRSGRYEVFVIFSYGANAGDTRYEIRHAGSGPNPAVVALAQRGRPGTAGRNNAQWHSLGTYSFEKGREPGLGSVTLNAAPGKALPNPKFEYRAYADAVRFVFVGK